MVEVVKTEIWDKVFATDPSQTKAFTRTGGFKGTAIKPLYLIHKATQLWGSMGDAWGAETAEHVISGTTVFIKARLWYPGKDGKAWVEHWGGDVLLKSNKGELVPNDEAFKMAFTDAVGKCLVQLGFSADVHMGLFDDNKYVQEQREASAEKPKLFANAALRNKYVDYCVKAYEGAETKRELNELVALDLPKLTEMRNGDEHDQLAAEEIHKRYKARLAILGQDEANKAGFPQGFNDVRGGASA